MFQRQFLIHAEEILGHGIRNYGRVVLHGEGLREISCQERFQEVPAYEQRTVSDNGFQKRPVPFISF